MNFNDFDRDFQARRDNFDRNFNRVATGAGIMGVVGFLVSLAVLGALAYVAHHFLMKVW